jgi:hypothetical protein
MISPFEWWLLIVGLAAGGALAWLVLADLRRREEDLGARDRAEEAGWIAGALASEGRPLPVEAIEDVLALHRWYLQEPPSAEDEDEGSGDEPEGVAEPDGVAALPDGPASGGTGSDEPAERSR